MDAYQRSPTLLQNLRTWMSTPSVSSLVLDSTRSQTDHLAAQVKKARGL